MHGIVTSEISDHMQDKEFQEKRSPFHGRFTHTTTRFWFAKLMNN